jgi:hypothetical protein
VMEDIKFYVLDDYHNVTTTERLRMEGLRS